MEYFNKFYIFCLLGAYTTGQLTYDNEECIIDKSLSATATDNYVDCTSEENVRVGKTECCTIGASIGCCEPGGNWKQFRLIGICLGIITGFLAIILIYWFWCRKNEKVFKATENIRKKIHGVQERYCTCLHCCRKQVDARKQQEVLQKNANEVGVFNLPSEAENDDPQFDSFWKGPVIKT